MVPLAAHDTTVVHRATQNTRVTASYSILQNIEGIVLIFNILMMRPVIFHDMLLHISVRHAFHHFAHHAC